MASLNKDIDPSETVRDVLPVVPHLLLALLSATIPGLSVTIPERCGPVQKHDIYSEHCRAVRTCMYMCLWGKGYEIWVRNFKNWS